MEKLYEISRFEESGESLFIRLHSTNNPVYLEHFFTEDEKLDIQGTIIKLVAELELKDAEYVAPLPVISKLEEVKDIEIKTKDIATAKTAIIAEKVRLEEERLAELEAKEVIETPLEVIE